MSATQGGSGGRSIGLPKTGGRKKGTPNRATLVLREKLAALGCDPAEELVKLSQDPKTPRELKVHIFSMLMPYIYPKPKPIADSDEEGQIVNLRAIMSKEAPDLARQLISLLSPRAATQEELSNSLNEGSGAED